MLIIIRQYETWTNFSVEKAKIKGVNGLYRCYGNNLRPK